MTEDERACEAMLLAREYLYTLFHKVFGGEPSPELLAVLCREETLGAFGEYEEESEVIAKCAEFLASGIAPKAGDAAFVSSCVNEYAEVFYGFSAAPAAPSGSYYLSGDNSLLSEVTLSVRDRYRAMGYLPVRYPRVPDDHIALEADFMSRLAAGSTAAFETGDYRRLVELLQVQSLFLRDHLGRWIPLFAKDMRKSKEAHLYPQLVQALEAFVELDSSFINNVCAWLAESKDRGTLKEGGTVSASECEGEVRSLRAAMIYLRALRLEHLEDNELKEVEPSEDSRLPIRSEKCCCG